MTASSTRRSRGVSSSEVAISSNMLTTSPMRQGGGQSVQPQPSESGASQPVLGIERYPVGDFPWRHQVTLAGLQLEPAVGPQSEIHGLGQTVLSSQLLVTPERISTLADQIAPIRVGSRVP